MAGFKESDLRSAGWIQESKGNYVKGSQGVPGRPRKQDNDPDAGAQTPHVEHAAWMACVQAALDKEEDTKRVVIRITSARGKLTDQDNVLGKFLIDRLREAGILEEDNPKVLQIEPVRLVKMDHYSQEGTVIEISME